MKGHVRNIPTDRVFGFIKASTGLDNIFLHKDNFHGDWSRLVAAVLKAKNGDIVKVKFDLEDSPKGPRAIKCSMVDDFEWKEIR